MSTSTQANAPNKTVYSTVPFGCDPDFIKRGVVLDRVRHECLTRRESAVLLGPEGVGKTSLALEFAHTLLQENKISVFWIDASSPDRYEASVRAIAETCNIQGRDVSYNKLTNIVRIFLQSFGTLGKVNWCIILDGADHYHDLFGLAPEHRPLHLRLPHKGGLGCILTTTRNQAVAAWMGSIQPKIQNIGPMTRKDALALYQVKVNAHPESDTWKMAGHLVQQLDYNPTTITRAAISKLRYLKMSQIESLSNIDIRKIVAAESSEVPLHNREQTDETPWDAAIDQLEQEVPSAASLLYLMSFFDDSPIPASVLQLEGDPRESEAHFLRSDQPQESLWDQKDTTHYDPLQIKFREDSQALLDRFLITCNEERDTFEIHHAIQLVARKRLASKGELERYSKDFIAKLARLLPMPDYIHLERVRDLWTHFEKAIDYPQSDDASNLQRATVLHNGSWCAMTMGVFDTALRMVEEGLPIRQNLLGEEHEMTLESQNQRALLLCYTRKITESLALQEATVERSTAVLGKDHHITLQGMHHLVPIYWNLSRGSEAIDVMEDVVEIGKRTMGEEHDETLACMGLLAHIYWVLQRLESAETLAEPLLENRIRLSGPDHPSTLSVTNTLASIYCDQKRYKEAKELLDPAVERMKRVVGENHPDTLSVILGLALAQHHLGDWQTAQATAKSVLSTLQQLANVCYEQAIAALSKLLKEQIVFGNPAEAQSLLFNLRGVIERALGNDHFEMVVCLQTLAQRPKHQGDLKSVVLFNNWALSIARNIAGETNPTTMTLMDDVANAQYGLGQKEEALVLMRECVGLRQRILGPEHPDTTKSMAILEEWERPKQRRSWLNRFKPSKKGS